MIHHFFAVHGGYSSSKSTSFDGSNDYVTIGQPADLDLAPNANEITIAAWVRITSLAAQSYVVAKARPYAPDIGFILAVNTDGSVFGYAGGLSSTSSAAGVITTNTWHLVSLTVKNVSGTYKGQIWVDGTHASSGFDFNAGANYATGYDWLIGASRNSNNTDYVLNLTGQVDEVSFWTTGLDSSAHTELYNGGTPGDLLGHSQSANLVHWYQMGDTDSYPTITDQVGSSDGTCTNMVDAATNFVTTVPP